MIDEGYLSDESSFYGDDDVKASFEERIADVEQSWSHKETSPSLTEIADQNIIKNMAMEEQNKSAQLYNIYQGRIAGRQLEETVDQFLKRLPPASTPISHEVPWIFIANPFLPRRGYVSNRTAIDDEAPASEESDLGQFRVLGQNLLGELTDDVAAIAKDLAGKPQSMVTKAQNRKKDETVAKLKELAAELKCTSGKWMLFVSPSDVNDIWSVVARATALGDLGTAAKVAPADGEGDGREPRVICIYTKDFNDLEDVKRVLVKLKDLGCFTTRGKAIYYKCDAYTHLEIKTGNEWNIKPSLYSSTDFLGASQQKMDGFLKRKA